MINISYINMKHLFICLLLLMIQTDGLQQKNPKTLLREKRDFRSRTGTPGDPYIITTIANKPFLTQKQQTNRATGNDLYYGFVPDFAKHLSITLNFSYIIRPAKNYGSLVRPTEWNGMISDIIKMDADFALADLTITSTRLSAVDFSVPYMTSGIGILMAKDDLTETTPIMSPWDFLAPFTKEVWGNAFIAFAVLNICLFVLSRFSPAEWSTNEQTGSGQRNNQFTVLNTMFYLIGSLVRQNTQLAARGLSTRLLSVTWWIFCFFVAAMYIANLAAILVLRMEVVYNVPKIQSVESLAAQTTVKYGTLKYGSTNSFFKMSTVPLYQRLYSTMESTEPSVFVDSYVEGVKRVRNGNFAFFMEATSIEYLTERDCKLHQVGGLLDYKGYGIAMRIGSRLKPQFDQVILQAQESGILRAIKDKWFKAEKPLNCDKDDKSVNERRTITVLNFGGIFALLFIGVALSFAAGFLEMIWRAYFTSREQGGSMFEELKRETRYAIFGGVVPNKDSNNINRDDVSLERQEN